jgi:hypothetical protein
LAEMMWQRSRGRLPIALLIIILVLPVLSISMQAAPPHPGTEPAIPQSSDSNTALSVTEIMYSPPADGEVPGADLEFIELHNRSDAAYDLSDATFSAGIQYTFAAKKILPADSYLVLASSSADFIGKYGFTPYDEYSGQLDNAGERITLDSADGTTILTVNYSEKPPWPSSADGNGFSLVLRDPSNPVADLSDGANWRASSAVGGSPGMADPAIASNTPPILVNEVLPHTDDPLTDSVEIYNPTTSSVKVGGWFLTDNPADEPDKFRIPEGTVLEPGQYQVFEADELGFGFSSFGEEAYIFAADALGNLTGYSHGFAFGTSANGVSFGRYITSEGKEVFPSQSTISLGAANTGPQVGPIVIREIMYHPGPDGEEYVRLTNISDEPVRLYDVEYPQNRWRFSFRKNAVGIGDYVMPAGLILKSGGELLIVPIEPEEFRAKYSIAADIQITGPYTGTLSNDGELIQLLQPDHQDLDGTVPYFVVDEVHYNDALPWPVEADGQGLSLRRISLDAYGNDPANWRAGVADHVYLPLIAGETP